MQQKDDITAVGIRFDDIDSGPEQLHGTQPVVLYTEQGVVGAGHKEGQLAAGDKDLAVGGDELLLPPGVHRDEARADRLGRHNISKVIYVVDVSSSMRGNAFPAGGLKETKLEYVRRILKKMGSSALPDAEHHIVAYDRNSARIDIENSTTGGPSRTSLHEGIDALGTGRGTFVSSGLKEVLTILNESEQSVEDRNLVVLLTDGQDAKESRTIASSLIREVADKNTAVQICGIGARYDQPYILDLTSEAGYAGWEHLPDSSAREDVMEALLEPMIRDLQSRDYFLQVELSGDYRDGLAMIPTPRRERSGHLVNGFQRESFGILFQTGNVVQADLLVGQNATDKDALREEIPIVDIRDAGAFYEIAQMGRNVIGPALFHLSLLQADPHRALESMKGKFSSLDSRIDNFLLNYKRPDDFGKSVTFENIAGATGTLGLREIVFEGKRFAETIRNPDSDKEEFDPNMITMPESKNLFDDGLDGPTNPYLHSGALGPLDDSAPVGDMPPADKPDPKAYGKLKKDYKYSALFSCSESVHGGPLRKREEVNFGQFFDDDGTLVLGRSSSCNYQLEDSAVSRKHCKLSFEDGKLYIEDLGSRNGTFIDDERIVGKTELEKGSVVSICNYEFTYLR